MDTPRPQLPDFQFHQNNDSFTLHFQQRLILTHSKDNPCLWIGSGIADIDMFRGNFSIKDKAGRLQRKCGRRLLLDFLPTAYVCQHAEVLLPC